MDKEIEKERRNDDYEVAQPHSGFPTNFPDGIGIWEWSF